MPVDELSEETRCELLGERDPKLLTGWEWIAAEVWVRYHFERYVAELPGSTHVTHQLDRLQEVFDLIAGQEKGQGGRPPMSGGEAASYKRLSFQPSDPVLQMALRVLGEDFRNPISPSKVLELKKLLDPAAKTPAGVLIEAVRRLTPGGLLKPDMLGLQSYSGELTMEEVEVGTRQGGLETYKELQSKVSILEDPCAVRMRLELARMQRSLQVSARASTWRLHPALMLLPLPLHIDSATGKGVVSDWICFWPTNRARFQEHPRPETGRPGYDGLVLYHVHRAEFDSSLIPKSVKERINRAVREWERKQRAPGPTLVPELVTVMQADRRLFTEDGELFVFGIGAAALLAIFVWVAVEAGVIAGLAAAGRVGLSALAATPSVLSKGVVQMADFCRDFLPVATQLAFLARTPARAATAH
ncbi:hypothetical protein ABT143_04195 [Streptomyces sp. NPDC002033]|uniref:hypothetical protein n=1 Tax=unclassified Streptomyces TaxID=2593676 RepID=UPI0033272F7A